MSNLHITYNAISVSYTPDLDGGGFGFGQDCIPVVRSLFGQVDRIFEFCAGPGFIGFSLLAQGLCRSLCLSDINPKAVAAARETVRRNGLERVVSVYQSDALDGIPSTEKWDLVVSNPPHFKDEYRDNIRNCDPDWSVHRKFYAKVGRHLKPNGAVLMQENSEGSGIADFEEMILSGGLPPPKAFTWAHEGRKNYLDSYYFVLSGNGFLQHPRMIPCNATELEPKERIQVPAGYYKLRGFPSSLAFKKKFGFFPRFLRKLGTKQSPMFYAYPGHYILRSDSKTIDLSVN